MSILVDVKPPKKTDEYHLATCLIRVTDTEKTFDVRFVIGYSFGAVKNIEHISISTFGDVRRCPSKPLAK
jgi:hypothetical protein